MIDEQHRAIIDTTSSRREASRCLKYVTLCMYHVCCHIPEFQSRLGIVVVIFVILLLVACCISISELGFPFPVFLVDSAVPTPILHQYTIGFLSILSVGVV